MVARVAPTVVETHDVHLHYGNKHALKGIDFKAKKNGVTALIGPSGCGKSTFLRCLNRMNDRIPNVKMKGKINIDGIDPYAHKANLMQLRRKVGMVFQRPNPFPMSIYDNIAMAPKMHFGAKGSELDGLVESCLKKAALWDEVKGDIRKTSGLELSGGQQQRLCIARMLAINPSVVLMDEPCSALDPIATAKIEELIVELAKDRTVLVVTHNLQQAARISKDLAFFMLGELIEYGDTEQILETPQKQVTEEYVRGRFG